MRAARRDVTDLHEVRKGCASHIQSNLGPLLRDARRGCKQLCTTHFLTGW